MARAKERNRSDRKGSQRKKRFRRRSGTPCLTGRFETGAGVRHGVPDLHLYLPPSAILCVLRGSSSSPAAIVTSPQVRIFHLKLPFKLRHWRWLLVVGPLVAAVVYALVVATPEIGPAPPEHGKSGSKLWSFGFVGDTQLGEQIVEDIFSRFEEAKVEFIVHLGDMVDDADDDAEWDELLRKAARHRIRLMPVAGNHDRLAPYADRGEVRFRQYFPDLPKTFYHFRHRNINFLMLNSEYSFLPGSEQGEFVRWQLKNHPGTTVVCLHRPVFTCGGRDWPTNSCDASGCTGR